MHMTGWELGQLVYQMDQKSTTLKRSEFNLHSFLPALGLDHKIFCQLPKLAGTRSSLPQLFQFRPNGWNRDECKVYKNGVGAQYVQIECQKKLENVSRSNNAVWLILHTSRCTVIRTFWVFFLKKLLWGPRTVSYTHLTLPTNREV